MEIRWEDIIQEDDSSKVLIFDMEFDETLEEDEIIACGGPGSEVKRKLLIEAAFSYIQNIL